MGKDLALISLGRDMVQVVSLPKGIHGQASSIGGLGTQGPPWPAPSLLGWTLQPAVFLSVFLPFEGVHTGSFFPL